VDNGAVLSHGGRVYCPAFAVTISPILGDDLHTPSQDGLSADGWSPIPLLNGADVPLRTFSTKQLAKPQSNEVDWDQ